jgi:hypothetical protein
MFMFSYFVIELNIYYKIRVSKPDRGRRISSPPKLPGQTWHPHILPFNVSWGSFSELKWPGREVYYSTPSGAEVKNEWSYSFTLHIFLHCVDRDSCISFILLLKCNMRHLLTVNCTFKSDSILHCHINVLFVFHLVCCLLNFSILCIMPRSSSTSSLKGCNQELHTNKFNLSHITNTTRLPKMLPFFQPVFQIWRCFSSCIYSVSIWT